MKALSQELINNLVKLYRSDQLLKAEQESIALLKIYPNSLSLLNVLGVVLMGQLKFIESLNIFNKIISINPDHASAYGNMGLVLKHLGRIKESKICCYKAIQKNPENADAYSNLAVVLKDLGELKEALDNCNKCIQLKPDYSQAYYNRGEVFYELGQFKNALGSYDKAIQLNFEYTEAYINRGIVLSGLGYHQKALQDYTQSIKLNPNDAEAYSHRGDAFKELGQMENALQSYEKAFQLQPDYAFLTGNILDTRMEICDWHQWVEKLKSYETDILSYKKIATPFSTLSLLDSPEIHLQAAKVFTEANYLKKEGRGDFKKRKISKKIRIGYYSADFHNHATAYLMAELFEEHNTTKFELFGFSFGPNKHDKMRKRITLAFNKFLDVRDKSDLEVARLSRKLGIDIAIDLKGYTKNSRTGIFAQRCAPIQVNYLGYPGTMGSDYIDYIIADKIVIPEDRSTDFTEKIVYLPYSYQVNDSKRKISERVFSKQEMGLPESGIVFCCFNNSYKILPSTFESWMKILSAVEFSVLWLFESNPTATKNLRKEATARGIDSNRLVFANKMPLNEHLARYRLADLFLDTLPYNAHTTASDALWAGLPVLTCTGKSFASRVAASLLNAIDLPELITSTGKEYEARAIELASNTRKLLKIKSKLERNRLNTPLFDAKLFAKHIEIAYGAMYEHYQDGRSPEHIFIDPIKN